MGLKEQIGMDLLFKDMRHAEVARRHKVSREYVRQVANNLGIERWVPPPKALKPRKIRLRLTIEERFLKYVHKTWNCWFWIGNQFRPSPRGSTYGYFNPRRGYSIGAHRAAYELWRGPIPRGVLVRHTCDIGTCVNPDHLILGTDMDNYKDAISKGVLVFGNGRKIFSLDERTK